MVMSKQLVMFCFNMLKVNQLNFNIHNYIISLFNNHHLILILYIFLIIFMVFNMFFIHFTFASFIIHNLIYFLY